jgi:thiosulfate/3-mercaptopyruvate sulfurtransferase
LQSAVFVFYVEEKMKTLIHYFITFIAIALLITAASCNQTAAEPVATAAMAVTDVSVPTVIQSDLSPTVDPVKIPGFYVHPEAMIDVSWVAAHLNDPTVRILDAREPYEQTLYMSGHIPGAIFVDTFNEFCCPSMIMGSSMFAQLMGMLGIGDDTTVVVYDTDGGLWAARVWWALKYYGHNDVRMLNGGLLQWAFEKQPLETKLPKAVTPAIFNPREQPQWKATFDEVKQAIEDPDVILLDALTLPNYNGDLDYYDRPGHIATALSFPAPDTLDPVSRMVLRPEELAPMLMRLNLDPKQRVITYCGGGFYGAHAAFILYLMGFENVGLYDGSLLSWTADPSNPMEVVP